MPKEPEEKRAISFIDGQNLFRHAMDVFGHHHPNYDPKKLTAAVCAANGWKVAEVRFYTGVPEAEREEMWPWVLDETINSDAPCWHHCD